MDGFDLSKTPKSSKHHCKIHKKLKCEFKDNTLTVFVPNELAKIWIESQLVGLEHLDSTTENDQVRILIEKDFKCMHVRINEDESDSFPHPRT